MAGITEMPPGNTPKAGVIGRGMRDARKSAGLSGEEVARLLTARGYRTSQPRLSNWEMGKRVPEPAVLTEYLRVVHAPESVIAELLAEAKHADDEHWLAVGDNVQKQIRAVMYNESIAERLFVVSPSLVPGSLQTRDYAWAMMRRGGVPDADMPSRVALRVGRREAIIRHVSPVHMEAFIGEAVLYQRIGGNTVMREQFAFLGELAARPNISIRIVPLDTDWHPGMEGLFSLSVFADRNPLVFVENRVSGLFFDKAEQVNSYMEAVDKIKEIAREPESTPALLANAIERTYSKERTP